MALYKTVDSANGAAVNNAIRDPLQGFDADVWMVDQATGNQVHVGRFTSIQLTVRNATEPYMEFNQRVPRMLDGEFQFGWVLERGLLDTRVIQQTFGFNDIRREMRISRSPRFLITFDLNAPELDERGLTVSESSVRNSALGELITNQTFANRRHSTGQYRLSYCKVDSMTIGAMAGRSVIAVRWEGLAEGITYVDQSSIYAGTVLGDAEGNLRVYGSYDGDSARPTLNPINNGRPGWAVA